VAPQLPHLLPISWRFASGQVQISGASARCIESSPAIIRSSRENALTQKYNSIRRKRKLCSRRRPGSGPAAVQRLLWERRRSEGDAMPVTVILELKFKPDAVAAARDVMGRALRDTRAYAGNLRTDVLVDEDDEAHWLIYEIWATVEDDEAYRAFRAGEGKLTDLPPLLGAPPVKTRYLTSDI